MNVLTILAPAFQQGDSGGSAASALPGLIIGIFMIVCFWKIFEKAGQPGWHAIIPIWNTLVMLKIAGRPWWWIFMFLIPFVNFVFAILLVLSLGRSFGRSAAFSIIMLLFCGVIGFAMLAFGGSRYLGPGGNQA